MIKVSAATDGRTHSWILVSRIAHLLKFDHRKVKNIFILLHIQFCHYYIEI